MKILIADDSAYTRKLLASILARAGYRDLVEAENWKKSIEKFKKEKPDLVLLDIIMEEKSGIDVLEEIMNVDPKANVIMVSAMGQESLRKKAKTLGAKDYIVKPVDHRQLLKLVNKFER